jgi:hypothetical protein
MSDDNAFTSTLIRFLPARAHCSYIAIYQEGEGGTKAQTTNKISNRAVTKTSILSSRKQEATGEFLGVQARIHVYILDSGTSRIKVVRHFMNVWSCITADG